MTVSFMMTTCSQGPLEGLEPRELSGICAKGGGINELQ